MAGRRDSGLALSVHACQQVPMVIVSHDREFLDQLCTKIVEVERGVVRAALCALV